jgi:hypothetical protein
MGGRIGPRTVYVEHPETHAFVRLNPGDEIPAELAHLVTAGAMAPEGSSAPAEKAEGEPGAGDNGDGYDALKYQELRDLAKERELPTEGKTDDLIARLREDDAEKAEGEPGAGDNGDDNSEE